MTKHFSLGPLIFCFAFVSMGCSRKEEPSTRIRLTLPEAHQKSFQASLNANSSGSLWQLSDPIATEDLNCFAVMVKVPESAENGHCKNLAGEVILSPKIIAGAFAAGSTQDIFIPSGADRVISLIGFRTDSMAACLRHDFAGQGLDKVHFSAPFLLDTVTVSLQPGEAQVVLKIPEIVPVSGKFENCEPTRLDGVNSHPPTSTTLPSSTTTTIPLVTTTTAPPSSTSTTTTAPPPTPSASFSSASSSNSEIGGTVTATLTLSAAQPTAVTVDLFVSGSSTATSSADYTGPGPLSVLFAPGSTSENVSLTLVDDGLIESTETVVLEIDAGSGYTIGGNPTHTFSITDNDEPTASLSGTPANPSGSTSINVTVGGSGVTNYKYWLGSGTNCSSASYGSTTSTATSISSVVPGDGTLVLCVLGQSYGGIWQSSATSYVWLNDTTPPLAPTGLSTREKNASLNSTPIYTWLPTTDSGTGVEHYEVSVGSSPGADDIVAWTQMGSFVTSYFGGMLNLSENSTYYFRVRAKDFVGNVSSFAIDDWQVSLSPSWLQQAYIKATNNGATDMHGYAVALHGDTLVVSAPFEDSNQSSISNGNFSSSDNTVAESGAVYVYRRSGNQWIQEAYLKASNAGAGDKFGTSVDIYEDTIVIGAPYEDSNQTNITNGSSASFDNSLADSGAVYVFVRDFFSGQWEQQAYIKASNANSIDKFGLEVSLSKDTLAVSMPFDDSAETTILNSSAPASADNSATSAGAVFIYKRTGTTWDQQAYIKAANAGSGDSFGDAIDLNEDTLIVGALMEDSNQTTVTNGTTASALNSAVNAGAAYIYFRTGSSWSQQAYLKASSLQAGDSFGDVVAVYGDTVVVGSWAEDSADVGVVNTDNTSSADNSNSNQGAAYIFQRSGTNWLQTAFLKPSYNHPSLGFGSDVEIFADTVIVSSTLEPACDILPIDGTTGGSSNSGCLNSGAVYVFQKNGSGDWAQSSYLKPTNTQTDDSFGMSVAISGSGIVASSPMEDSDQNFVMNSNTSSTNNSNPDSGAVYVFEPLP